ncbi:MAG: hypothetical protein WCX82_00885 [archaeon]|jgi:hypothetical protein
MIFKKAIEPLIATILLVVVAVILVTIVLAWGKNFANEGLNKTNDTLNDSCEGATINISRCDYNGVDGNITFLLRNTSDKYTFTASDFNCNTADDSNALNNEMNIAVTGQSASLTPGQTIQGTCPSGVINAAAGAKVTLNVRSVTCPNLAVSEMRGCS